MRLPPAGGPIASAAPQARQAPVRSFRGWLRDPATGQAALAGAYWALAGVVVTGAVVVGEILGDDSVEHPGVVAVLGLAAVGVGAWRSFGSIRSRAPSEAVQRTLSLLAIVIVAAGSLAAGGTVGVAVAGGFAFVAIVAGMHDDRIWRLAYGIVAAAAYAAVVAAAGLPVGVWVLVVGLSGVAGFSAGDHHHRVAAAAREVDAAERWRSDLMATLAHDLRSPLAASQSMIDLILQRRHRLSDQQIEQMLRAARRQTERGLRLAHDLLDAERVQAGRLTLERQPVAVRDVLEVVAPLTEDLRIEMSEDVVVEADPARLEQIVANLIGNAEQHGSAPIDLEVSRDDTSLRLAVRDHGTGVPEEMQATLFERFATGQGGSTSTGLGLWIAARLVEAHDGTIAYEDADPGARFVVSLPLGPEGAHTGMIGALDRASVNGGRRTADGSPRVG